MQDLDTGTLAQLDAKLRAEVFRLHEDTKGRHGLVELSEDEARTLLTLVEYARNGAPEPDTATPQLPL